MNNGIALHLPFIEWVADTADKQFNIPFTKTSILGWLGLDYLEWRIIRSKCLRNKLWSKRRTSNPNWKYLSKPTLRRRRRLNLPNPNHKINTPAQSNPISKSLCSISRFRVDFTSGQTWFKWKLHKSCLVNLKSLVTISQNCLQTLIWLEDTNLLYQIKLLE